MCVCVCVCVRVHTHTCPAEPERENQLFLSATASNQRRPKPCMWESPVRLSAPGIFMPFTLVEETEKHINRHLPLYPLVRTPHICILLLVHFRMKRVRRAATVIVCYLNDGPLIFCLTNVVVHPPTHQPEYIREDEG